MKKRLSIGPRVIKTGAAGGAALFLSQVFHTQAPFFAVIAAVVALQPTVYESIQKSKERILGTIVGIAIGIIFALIAPRNPIGEALGIMIILVICNYFNWKASSGLATIVFASLTIKVGDPIVGGIDRLIDTVMGISVAVIINHLFAPVPLGKQMEEKLKTLLEKQLQLLKKSILQYIHQNVQIKEIRGLQDEVEGLFLEAHKIKYDFQQESKFKNYSTDSIERFNRTYEILDQAYDHIQYIAVRIDHTVHIPWGKDILQDMEELIEELSRDTPVFEEVEQQIEEIEKQIKEEKYQLVQRISLKEMMHFLGLFYNMEAAIHHLRKLETWKP